MTFIEEWFIRC